jgi:hypothetical protein
VRDEDAIDLPDDDFRRLRRLLAPHVFADAGTGIDLPPTELVNSSSWDGLMDLPTDVALRGSSHEGRTVDALHHLTHVWTFQLPMQPSEAPFMSDAALLTGEEFDALAFIAIHGYYRQALGCLRNALEVLTVAAGLAVTGNSGLLQRWRAGHEVPFGHARDWLAASGRGRAVDAVAAPEPVFAGRTGQLTNLYARLCGCAHSRAGTNNMDFWDSNGARSCLGAARPR